MPHIDFFLLKCPGHGEIVDLRLKAIYVINSITESLVQFTSLFLLDVYNLRDTFCHRCASRNIRYTFSSSVSLSHYRVPDDV